ncbi:MAG: tRNA adenosine(34) deaminase TadA [Actinomycetota bacterium]
MTDEEAVKHAIELSLSELDNSKDVPVAALILNESGEIISVGTNERELLNDPTAHAEIVAIRRAAEKLDTWRLDGCTLVVTLEPCAMCAGAVAQSRISRLVFGAWDSKAGAVGSVWDVLRDPRAIHKLEVVSGVMADECAEVLQSFFKKRRQGN